MNMKIINLLLLLVLAMTANAQNVSSGKDSTSMPDLRNDVFVILTTMDNVWRDTCVYGEGLELFKSIRMDAATPPREGFYRAETYFPETPYPHLRFCSYTLKSESKGVGLGFTFILEVDSVTREVRPLLSDTRILTLPRDFLEKVTLLDMDKEFPLLRNKEEAERLEETLGNKIIWVIDRKTMTDTTVTLVETGIPRAGDF